MRISALCALMLLLLTGCERQIPRYQGIADSQHSGVWVIDGDTGAVKSCGVGMVHKEPLSQEKPIPTREQFEVQLRVQPKYEGISEADIDEAYKKTFIGEDVRGLNCWPATKAF